MKPPASVGPARWFRRGLALLALVFAASTILYSALWMKSARWSLHVELGFDNTYIAAARLLLVDRVADGSPAEQAGMLGGDHISEIDGIPIQDGTYLTRVWMRRKPGDRVTLTVLRPGRPSPIKLQGVFRKRLPASQEASVADQFATEFRNAYPVPFVLVGLTVLFLRLADKNAWLLALLFAGLVAAPGIAPGGVPDVFRPFATAYRALFVSILGPLFYFLFAVFPGRSPMDRRWPWLKWLALGLGVCLALAGSLAGNLRAQPLSLGNTIAGRAALTCNLVFIVLGSVSLALNALRTRDAQALRKIRVICWGAGLGIVPPAALTAAQNFWSARTGAWLDTATVALLFLFPLFFAYAVVKHRVLEIPVLIRRSARYLLVQRGFTLVLSVASIALTVLFALWSARLLEPGSRAAQPAGVALGAFFGTLLIWSGSNVHRSVSRRIDRAFFRGAYDARVILEDLAEKTRSATDRAELAALLKVHIGAAFQPAFVAAYFEARDGRLAAATGAVAPHLAAVPANSPFLAELARRGRPWHEAPAEDAWLAELAPDCLAPIAGRGGRLLGLLALGPRLSDEPYSGDDKRLLSAVASQAGAALENMRLAEEIAERLERERRAAREMEIASQVQSRLLPQAPPRFRTLDCAAGCVQARSVGGDYYDFIDLADGRTALALADVSGKGVHAALLMAALQAHLRSHAAIAPLDPAGVLRRVNRTMWQSTAPQHFATAFYGVYDDRSRRLLYVNCGHNPPLWLRANGYVVRLEATATMIGLFEPWDCAAREIELAPGDLLAVFSDGITEAPRGGEEFGEERLVAALRDCAGMAAADIVPLILERVGEFSEGAAADDLTLLIARGRVEEAAA